MPFKTLNVPSFFVGIATVLALLTVGFGGGVLMSGMLSGTSHKPNKIERQAANDTTEAKPAATPVIPAAPVAAPVSVTSAPAQAAEPAPAPMPPTVQVESQPQWQPAPQPRSEPQQAAQSQPTAQAPALGAQKPVSLVQPSEVDPAQLSRREQARYWRDQRREERALRREERRKQVAERRQQEQVRGEEMRPIGRARLRDVDDDDEPRVVPMRPSGLFGGLFGRPRNDDD